MDPVDRILTLYKGARSHEMDEGLSWYDSAGIFALELTSRFWLASCRHAAGVIAVLSPAVQWEVNKKDAESVCAAREGEDPKVSTYGQFKVKAMAIRDGDNPNKWINPVTSPKVWSFYRCIYQPKNKEYVVIDRHAVAICEGRALTDQERSRNLKRKGGYDLYSSYYKQAAAQAGILPSQMQAVSWVCWRGRNG